VKKKQGPFWRNVKPLVERRFDGRHCLSSAPQMTSLVPVKVTGIYLLELLQLSPDLWAFPGPRYGAP